jgi:hypothetical protein
MPALHAMLITKQEEEILYQNCYKNLNCTKRIYTNNRRIWWVPESELGQDFLSFTICQTCYRNTEKYKKIVEDTGFNFVPVIAGNTLHFNCDASEVKTSFNLNLKEWKAGIFLITENGPELMDAQILFNNQSEENEIIVNVPKNVNNNFQIGICLYKQTEESSNFPYVITIEKLTDDLYKGSVTAHQFNKEYLVTIMKIKTLMLIDETLDKNALYANLQKIVNSSTEKTICVDSEETVFRLSCLPKQHQEANLISILGLDTKSEADFRYQIKFIRQSTHNFYDKDNDKDKYSDLYYESSHDDAYDVDYSDDIIEL